MGTEASGSDALVSLEHAEDGLHLGVGHPRIARGVVDGVRAGGREQGAQVRFGHLGARFELADLLGERAGATLGFVAGLTGLPSLLASGAQPGSHLGGLATQVDHAIDDRSAEVRVAGGAVLRDDGRRRPRLARLAGAPPDRLLLAGFDRAGVEQPVRALRGLEALARDQRPHGARGREGVGEAEIAPDLGRRDLHHLAGLRPLGRSGEERVHPIEALFVHRTAIMPDEAFHGQWTHAATPG